MSKALPFADKVIFCDSAKYPARIAHSHHIFRKVLYNNTSGTKHDVSYINKVTAVKQGLIILAKCDTIASGGETMYRILIVEDDRGIADAIRVQAQMWDLQVQSVQNFRNVMEEFTAFDPHLVLLDITLPFFNGCHWCSQIRQVSKVPIIFISSASDNMNIIMAMNMGADDFVAKPFDGSVLMAKINALLRRTYDFTGSVPVLQHKGAILNTAEQALHYQGREISLSKNEYRILLTLMGSKGHVVSRERLMEKLWQTDCFVDENTLSVNMGRLRKKLDAAGLTDFIETKFGVGYIVK